MGTERGAPIGSRSSLRERWAALTTRYRCPPNYEAESSEAPTSASGGSVRKSRVSVRQREIGCRSVDRSKTPRCREDTTHRRTMPTAMAGSERSGLIFGPRGTVNDARRRGGTRPMPSQSRHCSCTCAQLSTGRPSLLLHVSRGPERRFRDERREAEPATAEPSVNDGVVVAVEANGY